MQTGNSVAAWSAMVVLFVGCAPGQREAAGPPEHSSGNIVEVRLLSFAVADAPEIDGRGDDGAWNYARAASVTVREVSGEQKGKSAQVLIKSVHTSTHIYFLVSWLDQSEDATHKTWVWDQAKGSYEAGDDREDVVALAFQLSGEFDVDMLADVEATWDVWHWKAARTGPAGYAMDKTHRYSRAEPADKAKSFEVRGEYTIWIARPEDAGLSPQKRQPAPVKYTKDRVPQYIPGTPSGSAADIRAKGHWQDGRWTVEFARRLDTGHEDDTAFDTSRSYNMGLSVFDREEHKDHSTSDIIELSFVAPLPISRIQQIMGIKGKQLNGEFKVAVGQEDLNVTVDGFRIIPPMGLTSWVAFTPSRQGAMIMGDLVVMEDEVGPVQKVLLENGIKVTAIHNHFLRDKPKPMFMHVGGMGKAEALARGVRAALDKIKELRAAKGLKGEKAKVTGTFDTARIEAIIGHKGKKSGRGVFKIVIGRPDVALSDMGVPVSKFMGFNTWAAFQGTAEKAAVCGDFAMLESEVEGVIKALVNHGIEVVALHNHMVHEKPRIFFLHYWGVGRPEALARGLKAALDHTGAKSR